MFLRKPSRPFDKTATSIRNLVLDEVQPLANKDNYIFVPSYGPYYTDSVSIKGEDGTLLKQGTDYDLLILQTEATLETGMEVAVVIRITNRNYNNVLVSYQAVGGKYQDMFGVLKSIKANAGSRMVAPVFWVNIDNKPTQFNPAAHRHVVWDILGWEKSIPGLMEIYQGIAYRQIADWEKVYQYWEAKKKEVQTYLSNRLIAVNPIVTDGVDRLSFPMGWVVCSTKPMTSFPAGVWKELPDNTVLYGVSSDGGLGVASFGLSKDIVYNQPDNILLAEAGTPVSLDADNNYIYLDNEFPAVVNVTDNQYWENIDETFDIRAIKYYYKQANEIVPSYTPAANKSSIVDDEIVLFTVSTTGLDVGTSINYTLSGVTADNVNVPLSGAIVTNSQGVATLAVKLIAGSPRTNNSTMIFTLPDEDQSVSINYQLSTNLITSVAMTIVEGHNNVKLTKAVFGEGFFIRIVHQGIAGNTVTLQSTIPDNVAYSVNNVNVPQGNNRSLSLDIPANTSETYLYVSLANNQSLSQGDYVFTLYDQTGKAFTTDPITLKPLTYNLWFERSSDNASITSIGYGQQFKLYIQHDGRLSARSVANVIPSAITPYLNPQTIPIIQMDAQGKGVSTGLIILAPTTPIAGALNLVVTNPYDSTRTTNISLSVTV